MAKGDEWKQAKKYDLSQVKDIIDQGFKHDWAIQIEYAVRTQKPFVEWKKWHKNFYAIKDSADVVNEVMACCKQNPECSMKLVCERFSPDCRFVYCIYRKPEDN